jgi:hypothetical protein
MTLTNTHLRAAAAAPRPSSSDVAAGEPSHIHIPRPSRLRPAVADPEVELPATAQRELAWDEAA